MSAELAVEYANKLFVSACIVATPLSITWAGALIFLANTNLGLLKLTAAMLCLMNVSWIISVWYGRSFTLNAQAGDINLHEFRKALGFMAGFTSFCGLAHWILCMNYFTLAIKIKFLKNHRSFASMQVSLKIFYYLIAMLNTTVPIITCFYWDSII